MAQWTPFSEVRPKCAFTVNCFYYPASQVLIVEFTAYRKGLAPPPFTGRPYIYLYDGVDAADAAYWFANDCDGTWYNYNIRGQPGPAHVYTRIR